MDELEKDGELESKAKLEPKTADEEHDNALNKELEDLRDMFQKELDSETEAAESGAQPDEVQETDESDESSEGQLIQELDEEPSENEEEQDKIAQEDLCECCGENRRDTSLGDDYPYCPRCRELMKANPFNLLGVVAVVVVMVLTGFVTGLLAKTDVSSLNTLLDANMSYDEGKVYSAADLYNTYFSSSDGKNVSFRAVKNAADLYARFGNFSYAAQIVNSYASKFQLSMPWNRHLNDYGEMQSDYEKAFSLLNNNFYNLLNGLDFDKKEAEEKVEELIKEEKEKGENGRYALTYLEFVKYAILSRSEADNYEAQIKQLQVVEETDTNNHQVLYIQQLLSLFSRIGDVENTQLYFDKFMKISKQESSVYGYLADAYVKSGSTNASKLYEIAKQSEENTPYNYFPYYYRIYALAALVDAKYDDALKNAKEFYDNYVDYAQTADSAASNLYALCAVAADDESTYKKIKKDCKSTGITLSKSIEKYKNGKMTITEVLEDKGGEF